MPLKSLIDGGLSGASRPKSPSQASDEIEGRTTALEGLAGEVARQTDLTESVVRDLWTQFGAPRTALPSNEVVFR